MSNLGYNILVLTVCWLLSTGAGVYLTFFQQPKELEQVKRAEQVARLQKAETVSLMAQQAELQEQAEEISRRWNTRYKVVPAQLTSPEVIGTMNELTQSGFENFDVSYEGRASTPDYSYYTFLVEGRGYYSSLYRFIWAVENSRQMYTLENVELDHIDLLKADKETQRQHMQVMVSFRLRLNAYYAGAAGLSAADAAVAGAAEPDDLPVGEGHDLPPVPASVLPVQQPSTNPFFPVILSDLPPNTYNRVDLEDARLISIVGGQAVFQWQGEYHTLGLGDLVYLGQITQIDAQHNRVVARLNKGGIIDEVELELQTGERYRQALGPTQLTPAELQESR